MFSLSFLGHLLNFLFFSELTSTSEKIIKPSPILPHQAFKLESGSENIKTETTEKDSFVKCFLNKEYATETSSPLDKEVAEPRQQVTEESCLLEEYLKNLSVDSNETIKNTEQPVRDVEVVSNDDDCEGLDDDENNEWNEFLDLQMKDCLLELEEFNSCQTIHNSNFLQMVLPLLKSPSGTCSNTFTFI